MGISGLFRPLSNGGYKRMGQRFTPKFIGSLAKNTRDSVADSLNRSLDTTITLPIKADVLIDTVITTTVEALIDIVLDESSLKLSKLVAHLDESLHIKEDLDVNIDTKITIPLRNLIAAQFAAMSQRRRPQ
jgi:hypothetical protein